jgi:DNA polymerase-1
MKALVDADSIVYKYASIHQDVVQWDSETKTVFTDLAQAKEGFKRHVESILRKTKTTSALLVMSPTTNFRYKVLDTYKWNRKPSENPLQLLMPLKRWVYEAFDTYIPCYVEADDYCVWRMLKEPKKWVLCHIDKDLNQAKGKHYNYTTERGYHVTQEEGEYKFYEQTLAGDSSDGYKGCPSIGVKRTATILDPATLKKNKQTRWEAVVATYKSKGLTEADALQQARVARMLTPAEYDGHDSIKLWTPTKGDK